MKFLRFVKECQEVFMGRRGFVVCSKVRAQEIGVAWEQMMRAVAAFKLTAEQHGRYGYTATK